MSEQPKALELAHRLATRKVTNWVHATGGTPKSNGFRPDRECSEAAAILRTQHAELEALRAEVERLTTERDADQPLKMALEAMGAIRQERDQLQTEVERLEGRLEFHLERAAQREQRLWEWAHEELSEPAKTRYFNIVANGTADVMEEPVYAQQCNAMKHRAERAEAEVERLRTALMHIEGAAMDITCERTAIRDAAKATRQAKGKQANAS